MIDFFSNYTTKILCLSIFIGIMQMALPNGKLKQNVLFTCMIVITIVIIEPFATFLNGDINVYDIYKSNNEEYEVAIKDFDYDSYYNDKVKSTYEENLRNDIVTRLESLGYKVNNIECECDENTLEPKSLKLEIETEDGFVQPVRIEVSSNINDEKNINLRDKEIIERFAFDNYGIKKENVKISVR